MYANIYIYTEDTRIYEKDTCTATHTVTYNATHTATNFILPIGQREREREREREKQERQRDKKRGKERETEGWRHRRDTEET